MNKRAKGVYEFGPFRLDVAERILLRDAQAVALTPKVFDLLTLLVENRGRLMEKDELLKLLWPDSFIEEVNLNVNVSALRKALGERPTDPQYIETVPKRGYRFVAIVEKTSAAEEEFPPTSPVSRPAGIEALDEAQAETPEAKAPDAATRTRASAPTRRALSRPAAMWILIVIAALTVIAGGTYFVRRAGHQTEKADVAGIRTIAVLPFKPTTGNDADNALGLGMADALITRLSNLRQITVRPTSAIQKYSGSNSDPMAAGRELGVDALLAGLVQQSDKKIRVSVQLLRVSDGAPIWADKFDDYFTNLFAVQDSISEKMADALSLKLTGEEQQLLAKRETENTEAYQLYVQGQFYALKLTEEAANKAIQYFKEAVARDPNYALAHSGMADAYLTLASFGGADDSRQKAREEAMKAVGLDDRVADAHRALGLVRMHADWDWPGAESEFRRAIELNGNHAMARLCYSTLLTALGRHDEAIREMEMARQLDPISLTINRDLAWTYYCARRYDQAIDQCKRVIEMDRNDFFAHRQLAKADLMKSMYEEAIAELKRSIELSRSRADESSELGQAYVLAGRRTEAERILTKMKQRSSQERVPPYRMALLYASLRENNLAFEWLEKAYQERATAMIYLKVEPQLDSLRSDRRFDDLVRRLRLP